MPAAPVKFAYWVPNVSGGLVTSTIEQRTDWGYERELEVRLPAGEPESETVPAHA
jgi:FMNH2-dependent dimethyl sulfone monooxygenase